MNEQKGRPITGGSSKQSSLVFVPRPDANKSFDGSIQSRNTVERGRRQSLTESMIGSNNDQEFVEPSFDGIMRKTLSGSSVTNQSKHTMQTLEANTHFVDDDSDLPSTIISSRSGMSKVGRSILGMPGSQRNFELQKLRKSTLQQQDNPTPVHQTGEQDTTQQSFADIMTQRRKSRQLQQQASGVYGKSPSHNEPLANKHVIDDENDLPNTIISSQSGLSKIGRSALSMPRSQKNVECDIPPMPRSESRMDPDLFIDDTGFGERLRKSSQVQGSGGPDHGGSCGLGAGGQYKPTDIHFSQEELTMMSRLM